VRDVHQGPLFDLGVTFGDPICKTAPGGLGMTLQGRADGMDDEV
jgi:hypothetical protein